LYYVAYFAFYNLATAVLLLLLNFLHFSVARTFNRAIKIFLTHSLTLYLVPFETDLFGNTGDGGADEFVPAVPRLQVNSAADLESVALQNVAVEDLHAGAVGQPEDADRQSGLATGQCPEVVAARCVEYDRPKYRGHDGPQSPEEQKRGIVLLAEEHAHLKCVELMLSVFLRSSCVRAFISLDVKTVIRAEKNVKTCS